MGYTWIYNTTNKWIDSIDTIGTVLNEYKLTYKYHYSNYYLSHSN